MNFQALARITFLDAAGDPIAAQSLDGSGTGEDHEKIGDLPTLSAFPGTYGEPVYWTYQSGLTGDGSTD